MELPPGPKVVTEKECPWPFLCLHDPAAALRPKHLVKNIAGAGAILLLLHRFW